MICPIIKIGPIINPAPGGLIGAGLIWNSQGIILTHTKKPLLKSPLGELTGDYFLHRQMLTFFPITQI